MQLKEDIKLDRDSAVGKLSNIESTAGAISLEASCLSLALWVSRRRLRHFDEGVQALVALRLVI